MLTKIVYGVSTEPANFAYRVMISPVSYQCRRLCVPFKISLLPFKVPDDFPATSAYCAAHAATSLKRWSDGSKPDWQLFKQRLNIVRGKRKTPEWGRTGAGIKSHFSAVTRHSTVRFWLFFSSVSVFNLTKFNNLKIENCSNF